MQWRKELQKEEPIGEEEKRMSLHIVDPQCDVGRMSLVGHGSNVPEFAPAALRE